MLRLLWVIKLKSLKTERGKIQNRIVRFVSGTEDAVSASWEVKWNIFSEAAVRCVGRIWLKMWKYLTMTKYLAQSSRLATFVMAAVRPVWWARLGLSNCQGDLDFDLLTNYPNSKFEYSKQLFTVLNPEREKRRTLHKIFQFRKIQRNTPFIYRLEYS